MSFTTSPNMSLIIPGVGSEDGPDYAYDVNASLTLVDQHDHSAGKGVQITPAGMNINDDLDFDGNFAQNVAGVILDPQGTTPDINTIYQFGNDLYFVDGVGNDVRLTLSGAVAGTPGSISNLVSPASASYSSVTGTFIWQSDISTPANMDCGSVILREVLASANGITLKSPASLAGSYDLTMPAALPVAQKFATISNAGAIAADWVVDNSTIEVSTNSVRVKDLGITAAKMASSARQLQKQIFTASGTFTAPAGTSTSTVYKVTCTGPGAGASQWNNAGSGGGGGATAIAWVTGIAAAGTVTVTVGTGGAGGASNTASGSFGSGSTSFGSYCIATRGTPSSTAGGTQADGGPGGLASACTGDIKIEGGVGNNGAIGTTVGPLGSGGSTIWGTGGAGALAAGAGRNGGTAGVAYGSGGGAGWSAAGGAGADGICVVEWVI